MTDTSDARPAGPHGPRLASGIEGLDALLLGGFIRHGLYIVQGAPGAGKTILSNQICYAHAAAGGRALYVTLLSEQHERLLANIGGMSFFDQSRVAREISYVSAFQLLERDGLAGLLTLLRREIVSHAASLLILDGLIAADAYATTELELKKFIHELQMLAAAADCTMFLLNSAGLGEDAAGQRPEHTMVDGMIALRDSDHGWRTERDIQVRKFRGSDHLHGRHALRITEDGVRVWPRIESLPLPTQTHEPAGARLSTSVPGLDEMLGGGLPADSSTVVLGPTGAGKTTIGLQFLSASTVEAPGLMLSFYETPAQLLARAATLAPHLAQAVRQGVVSFMWQGPAEDLIDRVAHDVLARLHATGARRLVIDGLLGFVDMTVQPDRIPHFYRALMGQLRALRVTTLCTTEVPELVGPVSRPPLSRLTPVAENLIMLRHVEHRGRLRRVLSVMKLRGSTFDTRLRPFEIGHGGIALGDDFEVAEASETGVSRGPTGDAPSGA
jgi:circadian clock protein KaiC